MSTEATEPRRPHPVLLLHGEERARNIQNRIADTITRYAGSMGFVYANIAVFAGWMIWFEANPWPTLTLAVSLEAIFLSTFVMISQNRTDEKRAVLANAAWDSVQREEKQNEELIDVSRQILDLTDAIHRSTVPRSDGTDAHQGARS
jgi:uncharacterized membrane protein